MSDNRMGGWRSVRLRRLVIEAYGTVCHLCGREIDGTVSVDHVIPRSQGGTDDIENLRPACQRCNSKRGNKPLFRKPLKPLKTTVEW